MTREKFTQPFINFINNHFDAKNNKFIVINKNTGQYELNLELNNVDEINSYNLSSIKILYFLNTSNKIIIHGLNSKIIIFLLFCQPWLLNKTYWVIWGADLYGYLKPKISFKEKLLEYMKSSIIKKIVGIIAYPKGDYERAVKWYGAKASFFKCIYYPYFAVEDYLSKINLDINNEEHIIMVGNSASISCEHIEVFDKLKEIPEIKSYKILCPLSYGDKQYAKKVIEVGLKYFGDNFIPLCDFIKEDEYYKLLSRVEIVIMAHRRQQATGNILALIKFGKKIFIRDDISTWNFYKENGITMYDYRFLEKILLKKMDKNLKLENKLAIKNNFTYKRVKQEWDHILTKHIKI
jgi:hypothetical protein